jgi:hypothetical protein
MTAEGLEYGNGRGWRRADAGHVPSFDIMVAVADRSASLCVLRATQFLPIMRRVPYYTGPGFFYRRLEASRFRSHPHIHNRRLADQFALTDAY